MSGHGGYGLVAVVVDMNIDLRERDGDIVEVECLVDVFADAHPEGPVVFGFDPNPHGEVDRTVGEVADGYDGGFGFVEDEGVVVDDLHEDFFDFVEVGAIGYAGHDVEADGFFLGVVYEAFVGEFAVGDDDGAAVEGAHDGVEDANFLDVAFEVAALDVVANLEGFHEEDDNAAGEVLERALEGHADGETHGAEEGDEGGGLDADNIHGHNDNHGFEEYVDQGTEETFKRRFSIAAFETAQYDFAEHAGKFHAHPEDEDGNEKFGNETYGHLGEGFHAVAEDGVLSGDHIFEVGKIHVFQTVGDGLGDAVGGEQFLCEFVFWDIGEVGFACGSNGDERRCIVVD